MQTKLQKWGNSLGLRIPKSFAAEVGVEAGSEVDLSVRAGELRVRALQQRRLSLAALLRKVTRKNLHAAIETGNPVGREVW
ncbi:MAG: AbrB/MazE/SpoVT family DNA-binding domain-containing protein [Candidatus Eisenbacteria bacterium]